MEAARPRYWTPSQGVWTGKRQEESCRATCWSIRSQETLRFVRWHPMFSRYAVYDINFMWFMGTATALKALLSHKSDKSHYAEAGHFCSDSLQGLYHIHMLHDMHTYLRSTMTPHTRRAYLRSTYISCLMRSTPGDSSPQFQWGLSGPNHKHTFTHTHIRTGARSADSVHCKGNYELRGEPPSPAL